MHSTTVPRMFTIEEAAEIARRTPKAMRQLRQRDIERHRRGEAAEGPPFRKIAGRILISEPELAAWLDGDAANLAS